MSRLVIIGASAMGRETSAYACECGMEVKGFLDSRTTILAGQSGYAPVLSSPEEYTPQGEDVFVCAIGDPLLHAVKTITILCLNRSRAHPEHIRTRIRLRHRHPAKHMALQYVRMTCRHFLTNRLPGPI